MFRLPVFILFLLAGFICSSQNMEKNKVLWGIKAGATTSQLSGDDYWGFKKTGFTGGTFLRINLGKRITGQLELLYTQKGSKQKYKGKTIYPFLYKVDVYYVEVPLLIQINHKKWSYEFGPGLGVLVVEHEHDFREANQDDELFNEQELSFNAGIQYHFSKHISLNVRYTNSLLPIRQTPVKSQIRFHSPQYNNVLAMTLNFRFRTAKERRALGEVNN